jgi:hypothetical protein
MTRIKPGQKAVLKPVKAVKERFKFEMDNLAYDIAELERTLAPKVVLFAREFATGSGTIRAAAAAAGYSPRSLTQRGTQLVNNSEVCRLIDAYKRIDQLEHGLPLSWKRYHLRKIVESQSSQDGAKIAAIRLLSELDGNLKDTGNSRAIIQVHLNLGQPAGEVIEHENDAPQVGADHSLKGGRTRGLPTGLLD